MAVPAPVSLAAAVLLAGIACTGSALAFGGTGHVMGRIVLPRADAPSVTPGSSPRSQYVLACAGCHGLDGAGSPEAHVPDLRQIGQFLRLPGGRAYVVKVPGVMASGLDDRQVALVTNWVLATLARGSAPADPAPFDAAEIQRARQAPLVDVAAERARLLAEAQRLGVRLY